MYRLRMSPVPSRTSLARARSSTSGCRRPELRRVGAPTRFVQVAALQSEYSLWWRAERHEPDAQFLERRQDLALRLCVRPIWSSLSWLAREQHNRPTPGSSIERDPA